MGARLALHVNFFMMGHASGRCSRSEPALLGRLCVRSGVSVRHAHIRQIIALALCAPQARVVLCDFIFVMTIIR